ncbi:MAG: hypothetical protein KC912_04475 [Proteobacteria bacterium]|nr:hypothetical protein [Pseudomonadota bacterium]
MDSIAGMKPTGRRISGPASDLIELEADNGLKHTAVAFKEVFWERPGITSSLTVILGFLESPMVTGLVELVHRDPDEGLFVYPTGSVWSVAEVIRAMSNAGRVPGIRAGLELCYVAGQVLMEAGESGPAQGIYSHGGLTPWRLLLKADGQVQLLGYGLPQVEVLEYLEDPSVMPREDSFRYCPPERLEGQAEDVTSDLFALALIGLEMMTGKPVYDGLVDDILQKARRAEGAYTLYKWRDKLPDSVREVLGKAIKFDPDTRYQDPNDFVHDVHDILSSMDAEGPSLMEVMETVRRAPKRGRALMGGQTAALSKEQLRKMTEEMDDVDGRSVSAPTRPRSDAEPEEPAEQPRWGKVSRRGRRGEEEEEPEPKPARGSSRRGRKAAEEPSGGRGRLRRSAGSDDAKPAESSGRGRLRRSSGEEEGGGRRLRRSSSEDGPPSRGRAEESSKEDARSRLRRSRDEKEEPRSRPRRRGEEAEEAPRLRRSRGSEEASPRASQDRPRRRRDEPAKEAPVSGAAALLAKLRSSSGVPATAPEPPATGVNAPEPTPEAPAPAPAAPAVAAKPAPAAAPPVVSATAGEDAPGEAITVRVGGAELSLAIAGRTVADVAARWTTAVGIPTDLSGRVTGWYCIEQGGERLKGSTLAAILDTGKPADLVFIQNESRVLTFEVEGLDAPIRFRAPVGMAVPAASIVGHLVSWLDLPAGSWALHAGDQAIEAAQVLGEAAADADVITVRR